MNDANSLGNRKQSEFSAARKLLEELLSADEIVKELEKQNSANAKQVYTNAATIFALVLQRLQGGLTLKETVKKMIDRHRDMLRGDNRRVEEGTLSENASAYDRARRNLPLKCVSQFCRLVCNQLADLCGDGYAGKRVYILDGTTIALPPTKDLAENFPTASNQLGNSAWPIMTLLVAHELDSSCCLVPEIGAMYGSKATSEIRLLKKLVAETMPRDCIVMGDSGFGVFAAAHHCRQNNQQFIFSLTKQRFRSHLKSATLVEEGEGYKTYELNWKPSPKELKKHTEIPSDATVHVLIHQLELDNGTTLAVITDVFCDANSIGLLYKHRYDCEFDIRDFKVTMDTENMRARSYDTVMKELYGSVIAYNLVLQFRRDAARQCRLKPRQLSFSDTWLDFRYGLLEKTATSQAQWRLLYASALASASGRLLPDRRGKRSYPRVAYTNQPKATKFEKRNRADAAKIREEKRRNSLE